MAELDLTLAYLAAKCKTASSPMALGMSSHLSGLA